MLGNISAKYESGGNGAKTISTGKGDPGGVSYGTYQLSSKAGTLQAFLRQSEFRQAFSGLIPGTSQFNQKWLLLCDNSAFIIAQHTFIKNTHFDPLFEYCNSIALRYLEHCATQEMLWSMSVQHSAKGCKKIITDGLKSLLIDYAIEDLIISFYQARTAYVSHLGLEFLKRRYVSEVKDVLALLK